jgi:hypothetical protein
LRPDKNQRNKNRADNDSQDAIQTADICGHRRLSIQPAAFFAGVAKQSTDKPLMFLVDRRGGEAASQWRAKILRLSLRKVRET